MTDKPTVLVTGASSGIGAVYADRFARRGHDLVLVARDAGRLQALAAELKQTGVAIDLLPADLTDPEQRGQVEARLRQDGRIGVLVNNAGLAAQGGLATPDPEVLDRLISLNVTAVTRLVAAAVPRFLQAGGGKIINVASVVSVLPEAPLGAYNATKAFVLSLSQTLNAELGARGLYVQAVMPAATRTELWERSGRDVNTLAGVMEVGEMVDAALVGFDRGETITIPSLPDAAQWEAFEAARRAMTANFAQPHAAARYRG